MRTVLRTTTLLILLCSAASIPSAATLRAGGLCGQDPLGVTGDTYVKIRVRLFVHDVERHVARTARLEITSAEKPVEVYWEADGHARIGRIIETWAFKFREGDLTASAEELPPHIVQDGGELLIAFITNPKRLMRNIHLAEGSSGPIDKYFVYDDARASVAAEWRKTASTERKRARRAIFYSFTPYVNGDPIVITGHYFTRMPGR